MSRRPLHFLLTVSLRTSDRFTAVAIRTPIPENTVPFTQKKGPATRQSPFSNRFNSSEIRIAHRARVQLRPLRAVRPQGGPTVSSARGK